MELKEFDVVEKRYVLCIDNIGQDEEYTQDQINFVVDTVVRIRNSWEKIEKNLLLKDRDLKLDMTKIEETYKQNVIIIENNILS